MPIKKGKLAIIAGGGDLVLSAINSERYLVIPYTLQGLGFSSECGPSPK